MKGPGKSKYYWIQLVKDAPYGFILTIIIFAYILINIILANVYHYFEALNKGNDFLDYYYFSFITALTIGFGDLTPQNEFSKILVILHGCFTAFYFSFVISILSLKLVYPTSTIIFSENIFHNGESCGLRIMNTHRSPLINPEIRIFFIEHCFGNVIATTYKVAKHDTMPYLGKHDLTIGFSNTIRINEEENISIKKQCIAALEHDRNTKDPELKSRLRIIVSISGSYGIQSITQLKKYYANNIVDGIHFKAIKYNVFDQKRIGNLNYKKFPNIWSDFNSIVS